MMMRSPTIRTILRRSNKTILSAQDYIKRRRNFPSPFLLLIFLVKLRLDIGIKSSCTLFCCLGVEVVCRVVVIVVEEPIIPRIGDYRTVKNLFSFIIISITVCLSGGRFVGISRSNRIIELNALAVDMGYKVI